MSPIPENLVCDDTLQIFLSSLHDLLKGLRDSETAQTPCLLSTAQGKINDANAMRQGCAMCGTFGYRGCLLHHRFAMPKPIVLRIRYRNTGWCMWRLVRHFLQMVDDLIQSCSTARILLLTYWICRFLPPPKWTVRVAMLSRSESKSALSTLLETVYKKYETVIVSNLTQSPDCSALAADSEACVCFRPAQKFGIIRQSVTVKSYGGRLARRRLLFHCGKKRNHSLLHRGLAVMQLRERLQLRRVCPRDNTLATDMLHTNQQPHKSLTGPKESFCCGPTLHILQQNPELMHGIGAGAMEGDDY